MTQIKIFRSNDIIRMENDINRWMRENADKVNVISVQNSQVLNESKDGKVTFTSTITFDDLKSKILHG